MTFTTELEGNPGYWWVSVFDDKGQKAYITEPFSEQWEAVDMAQGWIAKQENATLRTRVAELEREIKYLRVGLAEIATDQPHGDDAAVCYYELREMANSVLTHPDLWAATPQETSDDPTT